VSDEPVRRHFSHAISDGAPLPMGVRMAMSGRIEGGLCGGPGVGREALTPLRVTDGYAEAAGNTGTACSGA
jgi:hypothetical protein